MNLNELFRYHKGARSYDELERACSRALTSQRLQQIATTVPKAFPHAANISAIAKALGVREVVVVLAAAESLGLDVGREVPRLVQLLPAEAIELRDDEIAALAQVIRAFKAPPDSVAYEDRPNSGLPGGERERLMYLAEHYPDGPYDEALDALPHETDDPPPITGRSRDEAARLDDKGEDDG